MLAGALLKLGFPPALPWACMWTPGAPSHRDTVKGHWGPEGSERTQAAWARVHILLHHMTSKQLPMSAVAGLAC